jgi:hypothetical protein
MDQKREEKIEIKTKQPDLNSKQKFNSFIKKIEENRSIKAAWKDYMQNKEEIDAEITNRMGYKDFNAFATDVENILNDKKYFIIMNNLKQKFPELHKLMNEKGNIILNYYILKYVLPYLYSSAMSKKTIYSIISDILNRMKFFPNFKKFFLDFAEFLRKFGTPDGEAARIFISSEGWR